MSDVDNRGICTYVEADGIREISGPFNFVVNPKLL